MSLTGRQFSEAASRRDLVQFYAQYRTEHDVPAPVSGVVQFINNGGKIAQTFPLIVGHDDVSRSTTPYVNLQWDQSDTKYLRQEYCEIRGKNRCYPVHQHRRVHADPVNPRASGT